MMYAQTDLREKENFAAAKGLEVGDLALKIAEGCELCFDQIIESAAERYWDDYRLGDYDKAIFDAFRDAAYSCWDAVRRAAA